MATSVLSPQEKLNRFYKFLNIPIREGWSENLQNDRKSWFYYLKSLNLITQNDFEAIYTQRKPLEPNPILNGYMQNIDRVFIGRVKKIDTCVDVGAGWGWITFWLLLSGSNKVYALGDPERTKYIERVLSIARSEGLIPQDAHCEYVTHFVRPGELKYDDMIPANSVDLIFLNDTLEHINDRIRKTFFKASAYHLKKGGALISRCHHSASPSMMNKLQQHWRRFDEREGNSQRLDFVQQHLPQLELTVQKQLAESIYGLDSIAAKELLETYTKTGDIPPRSAMLPPIDLSCDVVEEGLTDRERILPLIAEAGLQGYAYPFMLYRRKFAPLQGIARAIPGLFLSMHIGDDQIMYEARKV